ncbi:RNA methyltransferase [uncultured Muriicola sp.]|uniref:TrmH family RNA methyltransferase n=1 Tax=uncultured Muriicola sp. TaxID=1583102 RepID=UPI0026224830|nr:RNA methyltransferase [uncultured Muriicola sp.]
MVVKSQIKFIKSLQQKKYRILNGLFVVEGVKMVNELLQTELKLHGLYTTNPELLPSKAFEYEKISEAELHKISGLKSPNKAVAIFNIPDSAPVHFNDWILVLDGIKDPGNLGTIVRLCDWFGIPQLVCSTDTVDCYNPKVLQATMGSIARVNIVYMDVETLVKKSDLAAVGAFMEGDPVYQYNWPSKGMLIMGNEAHGISKGLEALLDKKVSIPQFGKPTTESLNVATATAILLNELRRKRAGATQK